MANKIVALRVTRKGSIMELVAITESPRGTKVLSNMVTIPSDRADREVFADRLEKGIAELLGTGHPA